MSKTIRILFVIVLVSVFLAATVMTAGAVGGECPPGFSLHMVGHHDSPHGDHIMVGTHADKNGDGYICSKHATPSEKVHVHIDNNVMLGLYK